MPLPTLAARNASSGRTWPFASHPVRLSGLAKRPDAEAVSRSPEERPCPHRHPYQFIAIARTIARGFTEQAIGHPEGEALTEAARAIWRGIEVLEGMERHVSVRPGRSREG